MAGIASEQESIALTRPGRKVIVIAAILLLLAVAAQLVFVTGKTATGHPHPTSTVVAHPAPSAATSPG